MSPFGLHHLVLPTLIMPLIPLKLLHPAPPLLRRSLLRRQPTRSPSLLLGPVDLVTSGNLALVALQPASLHLVHDLALGLPRFRVLRPALVMVTIPITLTASHAFPPCHSRRQALESNYDRTLLLLPGSTKLVTLFTRFASSFSILWRSIPSHERQSRRSASSLLVTCLSFIGLYLTASLTDSSMSWSSVQISPRSRRQSHVERKCFSAGRDH